MNDTHDRTVLSPVLASVRRLAAIVALCALVATATATWLTSSSASAGPTPARARPQVAEVAADDPAPAEPKAAKPPKAAKGKQALTGKLNLNTATSEQLQLLPGVGPSKADRVVAWRKKNGDFKRVGDLRKVKGFGYKTIKKLEPYLDVKGESTLAPK